MTRDPREEAERLVATALAALSVAANSTAGFATGSAECCVCPVCKAIAAARDPDPEFAERLASGVGDLAVGLAGVLRTFGSRDAGFGPGGRGATSGPGGDDAGSSPGDRGDDADGSAGHTGTSAGNAPGDVWRDATAETPKSPKPMAKKAVKPKIDPEA
ncbi:hypothetical protein [Dactylosporangium sp. NPDC050588]|uniref:hypothetical protein n=1 Tax=Dactylosporangium sp. NPDC050588 TaxID=3157211 RepID=UPI0033C2477D